MWSKGRRVEGRKQTHTAILFKMCAAPQILRNHTHSEMDGACSTHRNLKKDYKFWLEYLQGRNRLKERRVVKNTLVRKKFYINVCA